MLVIHLDEQARLTLAGDFLVRRMVPSEDALRTLVEARLPPQIAETRGLRASHIPATPLGAWKFMRPPVYYHLRRDFSRLESSEVEASLELVASQLTHEMHRRGWMPDEAGIWMPPGRTVSYYIHGAWRDAQVLAARGDLRLLEYVYPGGTSVLSELNFDLRERLFVRARPYRSLSKAWLQELVHCGASWIGTPQKTGPVGSPADEFHRRFASSQEAQCVA